MSSSDGVTPIICDEEHFPVSSSFERGNRFTLDESTFSSDGGLRPSKYMIVVTFGTCFRSLSSFGNNVCDVMTCVTSVSLMP